MRVCGESAYCTPSATNRSSPSPLATSSSTDFLPSFLSWSTRFLTSAALADGFLRHLDDDVAGGEPLLGGVGIAVDTGDDHALDAVLDLVLRAQILAQRREIEAERLLRHRLLGGRLVLVLAAASFALSLSSRRPSVTLRVSSLPLRMMTTSTSLPTGGVGDDARQILRILDVLAVELDDDVAGLDAGRLGRALVVDAGDQRAARAA